MIQHNDVNESSFFHNSQSFVFPIEEPVDQYIDDDDPGFEIYEVQELHFEESCKELAEKFNYPARSIKPSKSNPKNLIL